MTPDPTPSVPALTGEFAEFEYFGRGPLKVKARNHDEKDHVISCSPDHPEDYYRKWLPLWRGNDKKRHYAIRRGTDLHRLNFSPASSDQLALQGGQGAASNPVPHDAGEPTLPPVPVGICYDPNEGTFHREGTRQACGLAFWRKWRNRKDDFPQDPTAPALPPLPVLPESPHKRVFEYDSAFRCLDCGSEWGALPGKPLEPATCQREPTPQPVPVLPEGLPPLPEPPAGHSWVYRGMGWQSEGRRTFLYLHPDFDRHWIHWGNCETSAGQGHYAELVPTPTPQPGPGETPRTDAMRLRPYEESHWRNQMARWVRLSETLERETDALSAEVAGLRLDTITHLGMIGEAQQDLASARGEIEALRNENNALKKSHED